MDSWKGLGWLLVTHTAARTAPAPSEVEKKRNVNSLERKTFFPTNRALKWHHLHHQQLHHDRGSSRAAPRGGRGRSDAALQWAASSGRSAASLRLSGTFAPDTSRDVLFLGKVETETTGIICRKKAPLLLLFFFFLFTSSPTTSYFLSSLFLYCFCFSCF